MQTTLALLSAFFAALYFVYTSRVMKRTPGVSSGVTLWVSHLFAALMLAPAWWGMSPATHDLLTQEHLWMPMLAATFLLVISRELYYYAYARTDVANITIFSALTPVYTLGVGYVVLGEVPSLQSFMGLMLICGSIYGLFLHTDGPQKGASVLLRPLIYVASSRPVFFAFLSTIPTAFAAVYQKTLLLHLDPMGLSFWMLLLIGGMALAANLATPHRTRMIAEMKLLPWHFYVVSAALLPLIHVLFNLVMLHQQTAISLVLQRTAIVFQVVLAYYWLGERRDMKRRVTCAAVVILGFVLIMGDG